MSDWLGEIKKRMKGPMLSASMTKGVRRDMNWLISEVGRLREAVGAARQNRIDRCAETGCMCDLRDTHCWSYFDEVLGFVEKN